MVNGGFRERYGNGLLHRFALSPSISVIRSILASHDPDFWRTYRDEVLDEYHSLIHEMFLIQQESEPKYSNILFNMFQVLTINFAVLASDQPNMRKLAGIKRGLVS